MRVTQTMLYRAGVTGLQKQFSALQEVQAQSVSGSRLSKPSDDPAAAYRQLILNSEKSGITSLIRNTGVAVTRLTMGEEKIGTMYETMLDAHEVILQMGNDYQEDPATMQAIAYQMQNLYEGTYQEANTMLDGVAIFGGGRGDAPFDSTTPSATPVFTRVGGVGSMNASTATVSNLDTANANYPGVPASVRLTYDNASGTYEVMVDGTADPSSPATPAAGVLNLGWAQFTPPAAPGDGDEFHFQLVPTYTGGEEDRHIKISDGVTVNGNVTGSQLIEGTDSHDVNILGLLTGIRGALMRGDAKEVSAWLGQMEDGLAQISDFRAVTGIRISQVEAAQSTLQDDKVLLEDVSSLNVEADMFDVLSKLEQTTQSIEVMTRTQRSVLQTNLVNLLG